MNTQSSSWGFEMLAASCLLFLGTMFMGNAQANTIQIPVNSQLTAAGGNQLAYHYDRRWRGPGWRHRDRRWRGHGYYPRRNIYWTGWRSVWRGGYRCHRSCLVDRWSGRVIRCRHRCR